MAERQIIFRGQRVDNDEWTEGYLFKHWNRTFILWGMTGDVPNMVEVKPGTVRQFTGLVDKNGKMIFEGDIFAIPVGRIRIIHYVVSYDDKYGVWEPFGDGDCGFYSKTIEIIGNIYDNKDLLEGKE